MLRMENSEISERRKRILRRKMGRTLNPIKESRASSATDKDISEKVSQLFESKGQSVCHHS